MWTPHHVVVEQWRPGSELSWTAYVKSVDGDVPLDDDSVYRIASKGQLSRSTALEVGRRMAYRFDVPLRIYESTP